MSICQYWVQPNIEVDVQTFWLPKIDKLVQRLWPKRSHQSLANLFVAQDLTKSAMKRLQSFLK